MKIATKYSTPDKHRKASEITRTYTQKMSYVILDMICSYLVSANKNIKFKGYKTVKELFDIINPADYRSDADMERINFIRFALDARLKFGITDAKLTWDYIVSHDIEHGGKYNINIRELSNKDVEYVNSLISETLKNSTFASFIYEFENIAKDFRIASSYEQSQIVDKWSEYIITCHNHIRKSKVNDTEKEFVSLRDGIFEEYARDTYNYVTSTSSKLRTGMVGMNYLLGGGFENGRVYGVFGLQGEGKSLTLLNLAYQLKMYNKNYQTKDPTKQPAVVYLTLENTKRESFTRLFSMVTGHRMHEMEADEGIKMMRDKGLVINDDNPVDIIIKYEPSNSVDTSYLYDLSDNLEENGYEVIAFIVDYINVIKSIDRYSAAEERLRLGSVINEMKTIAADLDIPIITAGQLNREANKKVDEARDRGSLNIANCIDRSNLGESMLILNNLDGAFIITPVQIKNTKEKYLCLKLVKHRYEPYTKPLDYSKVIYHPYEHIDSISLVCDLDAKEPVHRLDIAAKAVETYTVDESVPLPDNENRGEPILAEKEYPAMMQSISMNALYDDGTKPFYNVNWRMAKKYGAYGVINQEALSPEEMFLKTFSVEERKDIMNSNINSLNGISRYSDYYTSLYDPTGSKEQRLANDYKIKYGMEFTSKDFPMLYSHFMMLQNGEIEDTDNFVEPTKTYTPETPLPSCFLVVPPIDREAVLAYINSVNS